MVVVGLAAAYLASPLDTRARYEEHQMPPNGSNGIGNQMQRIVDGFATLVREHVALARLEFIEDAKAVGGDAARVAIFAPFLLVGYLLTCVAVGVFIGNAIGAGWGFLIVGALNLLVGGVGLMVALSHLRKRRVLGETVQEIRASAALLSRAPKTDTSNSTLPPEAPHVR